jgi:hypothetical protein
MLRAIQLGLKISDLDALNVGDVIDMITESGNDSYDWPELATKEDFARF